MKRIYSGTYTLPLIQCINRQLQKYIVLWDCHKEMESEEGNTYSYMCKEFSHKPSLQDVKDAIIGDINQKITDKIIGGFKWEDKPVWYSLENQINFSQSVAPCSIKIGENEDGSPVYVEFETSEALKAFNDACLAWKNQCLKAGRTEKEGIDWTLYEELLPQDESVEV